MLWMVVDAGPLHLEGSEDDGWEIAVGGKPIHLEPLERKMLTFLAGHFEVVAPQKLIYQGLWPGLPRPKPEIIRVVICNLRKALQRAHSGAGEYIVTKWGIGYQLSATPKPIGDAWPAKCEGTGVNKELNAMRR